MRAMEQAIETFAIDHEASVRLGFFAVLFCVMLVWELQLPRRRLTVSKRLRWVSNLGLLAINSLLLRL